MENEIFIDTIETYNNIWGLETRHPLVAVVDLNGLSPTAEPAEVTYHYGIYSLWLKQTYCGDITYGRLPYDYQEGTVTSFAPGQTIHVKHAPDYVPSAVGLLFHPDMIHGTSLGRDIRQYSFFDYSSREALHLSENEKAIFRDCLDKIRQETERPADSHSRKLICRNIELLLDYCMRFYDRQFITRSEVNSDILTRFERLLDAYFDTDMQRQEGLPSVKYFADKVFLSPNYFGDVIRKLTGMTASEHIQNKVIDRVKEQLLSSDKTASQIAYELGFQYPQHLSRMFKRITGLTPNEFRQQS